VGCGALVDELVLSELLSAFVAVLRALMPKGPNSYLFLQSEYAKVQLALDDMVVTSGAGVSRSEGGGSAPVALLMSLTPPASNKCQHSSEWMKNLKSQRRARHSVHDASQHRELR